MYPYSNADLMLHNLASLTVAMWHPIWNLVHLPLERISSFYQPDNAKIEFWILLYPENDIPA